MSVDEKCVAALNVAAFYSKELANIPVGVGYSPLG